MSVRSVERGPGCWVVRTDAGRWRAANVVVATGDLDRPVVPALDAALPSGTTRLHTSAYRNPAQLPAGGVLVVGAGLDVPPAPPWRPPATPWADRAATSLDLSAITTVVWATGFRRDFSWLPDAVLDAGGEPVHDRGVTAAPGLYVVGLRRLHRRSSSFLAGVGADAAHLAEHIAVRDRVPMPA